MRGYIIHYTLRNIQHNKKKYIPLLIGIILSVVLLTTIYTMLYNIKVNEISIEKKTKGDFHFSFVETDMENVNLLMKDEKVEKDSISTIHFQIGRFFSQLPNLKVDIVSLDNNAFKFMCPLEIKKGRMPNTSNEIIVEEWISRRKIGAIGIGEKVDTIVNGKNESYTVVGYYENFNTSQYTQKVNFYTFLDRSKVEKDTGIGITNIYFKLKQGISIKNNFSTYRGIVGKKHFKANDSLLFLIGEHEDSKSKNFNIMNLWFILPVIFVTIIMIYNSLNISVLERIKQFGLLRMIGASKRHIKYIILCEVLFICMIAIPIGSIISIVGLKLIFPILNFKYIMGSEIKISSIALIKSMLIILVTSIFASYIPARVATKLSPIDAALSRWNVEKDGNKKRALSKLYSVEFDLASRNIKRNRRRYTVTLLSVTVSVILFVVSSSIFNMVPSFLSVAGEDLKLDYSIYKGAAASKQELIKGYSDLKDIDEVDKVYKRYDLLLGYSYIEASKLNDKYKVYSKKNSGNEPIEMNTLFDIYDTSRLENACIENYLIEGNCDIGKMQDQNEVLIVQKNRVKGKENEKYYSGNTTDFKIGDKIQVKLNKDLKDTVELKVAGIITARPFNTQNQYDDVARNKIKSFKPETKIVISDKLIEKWIKTSRQERNHDRYLNLIGYDTMLKKNIDKSLASKKIIDLSTQMVDTKLIEQEDSIEKMKKAFGEVSLVTYVFVGIASLIGVLNLFNTCRANIIIRKREIAMLKAIGVTGKQIKQIINLEGAIFGIKGGLYGVAVSMIFVYSLYYFLRSIEYFKWNMPIHLPLIAMFVAVIGGYLSTIVPLIKVNKSNIINEIKVEG